MVGCFVASVISCVLSYVGGIPLTTKDWSPPSDFGVSNSSETEEWPTLPDHLCSTVVFPTHKLRGVPEDIKDFWSHQQTWCPVVKQSVHDVLEEANRTGICKEFDRLIDQITEYVDKEVEVILTSNWPTTKNSKKAYQLACVEKLSGWWEEAFKAYYEGVANFTEYEKKIYEFENQVPIKFREVRVDLRRRKKDLELAADSNE